MDHYWCTYFGRSVSEMTVTCLWYLQHERSCQALQQLQGCCVPGSGLGVLQLRHHPGGSKDCIFRKETLIFSERRANALLACAWIIVAGLFLYSTCVSVFSRVSIGLLFSTSEISGGLCEASFCSGNSGKSLPTPNQSTELLEL